MSTANVQPVAVRNIDVPSHVPSHTQTAAKCADFRFRVFTAETDWLCSARERARFARSLPLADGFDAIEAYLAGIGRSPTAFLRLRATLSGAIHRHWFCRFQSALCRAAGCLGDLPRGGQPGCPLERVPGNG